MQAASNHYPVIVIGTGPTGLVLANLLGGYGVRTLVLDRNPATVDEPRAVSIDDESLRAIQAVGLIEQVLPDVVLGYGVHYYSWKGRRFARIEPNSVEYGYPKRNAFRQGLLVRQLREGLARHAQVDVRFGHEVLEFAEAGDTVTLQVAHDGGQSVFSCDWMVACDGGRSGTRERLGIKLSGSTFAEKWLIVDLLERKTAFRHTRTYCDPARPAIRLPGPHGTVRYEFMLKEGETPEFAEDEARLRGWIRDREPLDADLPIARKVVYTFHARLAERWRSGRVFLAGDAAHLTPPFAGQGMNSGVRDAVNLAWKLKAVVEGEASPALLDSYETERKPHAWALIEMAIRIGRYMQPKTRLGAMLAQWALKAISLYRPARDYVLQLKFKPKPRFAQGFFVPGALPGDAVRAGQLLPQPRMEIPGGARLPLDQAMGPGYACIVRAGAALAPEAGRLADRLGARRVALVAQQDDFPWPARQDGAAWLRDAEGVVGRMLDEAGADAVLVRPDRYVLAFLKAGDARQAGDLKRLLRDAGYRAD